MQYLPEAKDINRLLKERSKTYAKMKIQTRLALALIIDQIYKEWLKSEEKI